MGTIYSSTGDLRAGLEFWFDVLSLNLPMTEIHMSAVGRSLILQSAGDVVAVWGRANEELGCSSGATEQTWFTLFIFSQSSCFETGELGPAVLATALLSSV